MFLWMSHQLLLVLLLLTQSFSFLHPLPPPRKSSAHAMPRPQPDQRASCMSQRFIRQGDKTDSSGIIVDGIAGTSLQGQPFAYLGAAVQCPACGTMGSNSS
ncbi:hypothetical protein WT49_12690 [Burkholderia territorii]|nr:hypothetical protein WT22_24800 [Burkholderia territorii]KWA20567.1 hypothetical protein WT38_20330 [Burkholderia territorii]KWA37035.1 hypothetical protein WT41_25400 [Burkholderia territorii]KWA37883.1 hypothetical protein WT40_09190 [Burkholderia territorii]KWE35045.1 hypothetical protein WT50_25300 [Burkholderia territorii]